VDGQAGGSDPCSDCGYARFGPKTDMSSESAALIKRNARNGWKQKSASLLLPYAATGKCESNVERVTATVRP
jgi:hypothetical protein